MQRMTEQLRVLNAGILEEDVARTLRRRKDKSGLVLDVLEAQGLSLVFPWKSVIQTLRDKMQKHRELNIDKTSLEDMGHVYKILHDAFYTYCHLVQKFNPEWFDALERVHHAQARSGFVAIISPMEAFSHAVWKKVSPVDVKQSVDYESLEAVMEAVDSALAKSVAKPSVVQVETARESEVRKIHAIILDGVKTGAPIPVPVNSLIGADVSERVEHRKGVSDELALIPAKLYASLVEIEHDWTPRLRDIRMGERLRRAWTQKIVPFITKLAECSALFEKDVVAVFDEDLETEMKGWDSVDQTQEIVQYIQHLRTVCQNTCKGVAKKADPAAVETALRDMMRESEARLLNEREKKNRDLCETTAKRCVEIKQKLLSRTLVREYVHSVQSAIETAVTATHDALMEVETISHGSETSDNVARALRELRAIHHSMRAFARDGARKLVDLDERKAASENEDEEALRVARTEWKEALMNAENAMYALFIIRKLQTNPLDFDAALAQEARRVQERSTVPREIVNKRVHVARSMADACTRFVRNEARTYAVPVAEHFAKQVTAACESIHKSIEDEIADLAKRRNSFHGISVIRRALHVRSGTAQSMLRKPVALKLDAAECAEVYEWVRTMRAAILAPRAEDVAGLSAPEMRVIATEIQGIQSTLESRPVDACSLWDTLHFLFFGGLFLDVECLTE